MENELESILDYWQQHTIDKEFGGFYGKIDNQNNVFKEASKGSVLNARILWTFSAAYSLTKNEEYLQRAQRSYEYMNDFFVDKEFGGVYWAVDYKGEPLDTKKQIYALAFTVYGLSEFYKCSKNEDAKKKAISLYHDIVKYSYDEINDGYIEALTRNWKSLGDLRLSEKDANEKKSMNTHLHVLEGFANLYTIWPDEGLRRKITGLLHLFLKKIINENTHHLHLFFDDAWNVKSHIISYGHDMEAAWLLLDAAAIIKDEYLVEKLKEVSVKMVVAVVENGLDNDGGLWYEYDVEKDHFIKEKHWWPQAESMIGFFNAWQISGDEKYLKQSLSAWYFIQNYIRDKKNGEWFWGVKEDYELMNEDKVGMWKCPYHNGRACLELIKRIKNELVSQ